MSLPATALASILSFNAVTAAPAGLASQIATLSIASAGSGAGLTMLVTS